MRIATLGLALVLVAMPGCDDGSSRAADEAPSLLGEAEAEADREAERAAEAARKAAAEDQLAALRHTRRTVSLPSVEQLWVEDALLALRMAEGVTLVIDDDLAGKLEDAVLPTGGGETTPAGLLELIAKTIHPDARWVRHGKGLRLTKARAGED